MKRITTLRKGDKLRREVYGKLTGKYPRKMKKRLKKSMSASFRVVDIFMSRGMHTLTLQRI